MIHTEKQPYTASAFMGGQGAKARTIAYSMEKSPCIKSVPSGGNTIPDVVYPTANAFMDAGATARSISYGEMSPPIKSVGGNATPNVVYPINTMVASRWQTDDGRTCIGYGAPDDPQFTISSAHSHAVAYEEPQERQENDVVCAIASTCVNAEMTDGSISPSLLARAGTGGNQLPIICQRQGPDRVYQNTGRGWWNESEVCETIRTPCGGDAMKANLVVEALNDESQ